jgi:hypothetical protein
MTDPDALLWDAHQQAITQDIGHIEALLNAIPDGHQYTATRNRLTMALNSLDTARDQLAAARLRYTDAEQR